MLVVAVVPLYPPASRVGAWLSTHECLRHLAHLGHTVHVCRRLGGEGPGYDLDGVNVEPSPTDAETLVASADVVISHLGDDGVAAKLALRHRRPLVRMVHGATSDATTKLCSATLAVFNSESARVASRWTGPSIVVHPPLNPADYRTTPGDRVTIVNLSHDKGGRHFWLLATTMPDVKFLGARGGYGAQMIRRRPNVDVVGPTESMRDDVYARTRILLMPSKHETWGRVGLEAMSSGIPVIAHPTPGLRESLGDAGIFADRNNLAQWRTAIRSLLEGGWREASERALRHVAAFDVAHELQVFSDAIEALA